MTARIADAWETFLGWAGVLADLGGCAAMLGWDRETVMPAGGAETRARQLGTLATILHRELVRDDLAGPIALLREHGDRLDPVQRRQVTLAVRSRERALRTPERLVRALSEARSRSVSTWVDARPADDFARFSGPFSEVLRLSREEAELLSDGAEAYDAMLDDYEPGARVADLEGVFADLGERLAPLVLRAAGREPRGLPERVWPVDAQLAFARDLAVLVGYDLSRGQITVSAHPFTSSPGNGDVRFTTHVDTSDPLTSILSVLHEAGHALYEQGFPDDYARTPVNDAPSLGAHESQSRFWENHVGRTPAFWESVAPLMRRHFPAAMEGVTPEDLWRAASAVRPSLIRADADEVTYNLHIALRFELEVALFRGTLRVHELPEAWDARMEELLGVRPTRPSEGVMQDIHWPEGLFGYFPTYTLGNLYAAQLAEAAADVLGPLDAVVRAGRFGDVLGFMRERIHRHAGVVPTPELMRRATGRELSADALVAHLTRVVDETAR